MEVSWWKCSDKSVDVVTVFFFVFFVGGAGEAVSYLNRHFVLDWRSGYNLGFESITQIMQQNGYAMSKQQYGGQGGCRREGLGVDGGDTEQEEGQLLFWSDRKQAYCRSTF